MSKTVKKKKVVVYTDGSCAGNGRDKAVGGIGIYFPDKELKNVSKVFKIGICTNQRTELFAILTAIRYIKKNLGLDGHKICIKTDSQYSIDCITKWVYGWIKNGWRTKNDTPVANQEFIEKIHQYYEDNDIELEHVDAHTGGDDDDSIFNDKADKLATKATQRALQERNINDTKTKNMFNNNLTNQNYNNCKNNNSNNFEVELISVPSKKKNHRSRKGGSKNKKKITKNKTSKR